MKRYEVILAFVNFLKRFLFIVRKKNEKKRNKKESVY